MRCLITGVAGFVGSHLAERLLALGHEVVGADCFTPYYSPATKYRNVAPLREESRFRLVEADLSEADLRPLVDGADWVFHLAGQPGVRASWGPQFAEYERHNIQATQRLLEALRPSPPRRLVFASSSSVYGDAPLPMREDVCPQPLSPYGITKLAAEQLVRTYCKSYNLPATMLRFFTVYGPRQRPDMAFHRFIRAIMRGEPIQLYGDGSQTRDFTYVDDVVDACIRAATCERIGEVLNVGGGSSITINQVLDMLGVLIGRSAHVERQERQRGDAPHTSAAMDRVRSVLQWQPAVPVAEGLRRQVEWQLSAVASRSRDTRTPALVPRRAHDGPRLLIYGHDTYGLGHLRRNLTIAAGLTHEFPDLSILLLTGSPAVQHFALPPNVDYVKLPAVVKVADEEYQARVLRLEPGEIVRMRTALVREAVSGFAPDVVLVDHAPTGMKGELLPALEALRQFSPHSQVALGLRDIVDEPSRVRDNWTERDIYSVLDTYYDAILVYGTSRVMDVVTQYRLPPQVAAKTRYCGYLPRATSVASALAVRAQYCMPDERLVLVTAGGGGDGYQLLHSYLMGLEGTDAVQRVTSIIVTGPFMPAIERASLEALAAKHGRVRLLEFADDMLGLMQAADLIVCMGGYNTLCEALSVGTRTLVVPRMVPRREQLLRAQAFAELGLVTMLHPDALTPDLLTQHVVRMLQDEAGHAEADHEAALAAFMASGALGGLDATARAIGDLLQQAALAGARAS